MSSAADHRLELLSEGPLPLSEPVFESGLRRLLSFSEYAFDVARRYPEAVAADWAAGRFDRAVDELSPGLDMEAAAAGEEATLAQLRQVRHRYLFRVLWRDVNELASIEEILAEQTRLAEKLIAAALQLAKYRLERFGTPRDADGQPLDLVVFGLGKLGGRELNFSSDVDLVYAYRAPGETDGKRRISAEEYFVKLGALLARLLSRVTADGFCYRVDLRLRPFGDAGRLALTATAMEQYFQREGREWERYAWIKARSIAGDTRCGDEILRMLRPFVYRRYLDYGAFESLREMKTMIRAEVARRELVDHVKLGRGGIREIEFFAQAFQLIRGGREPSLRGRSLQPTLDALVDLEEVAASRRDHLLAGYHFMRRLENRFQQVRDEQTHQPPPEAEPRAAIAASLGFESWADLEVAWKRHREVVAEAFDTVFETEDGASDRLDPWKQVWMDPVRSRLAWVKPLQQFRDSSTVRSLGKRSRQRLDRLMPLVLADLDELERTSMLERVLEVVASIARRSTYLALLAEQDEVRVHLIRLCAASPWLADRLADHPLMLDELIDRRATAVGRTPGEHLRRRLKTCDGDLELEMEVLREVRDSRRLGLAAAFLDGVIEVPVLARELAAVADALLQAIHTMAWRDLSARHGGPSGSEPGLAIIGYGTLGGRELSLASDLDLVFLYSGASGEGQTLGERPISNAQFFTRLSQRILHLVTTPTASGRLYEVDTRLRPNGRAGLLVSSLEAFESYQREEAWTWELQALCRARWVAGTKRIKGDFEAIRTEVIGRTRDAEELGAAIVEMRDKMRAELDRSDADRFDLKQGRGGRVDLEFLTQYARLLWASEHRELLRPRGTLDTLKTLSELELLPEARAKLLQAAYCALQSRGLRAILANESRCVPQDELAPERAAIAELWHDWLGRSGGK